MNLIKYLSVLFPFFILNSYSKEITISNDDNFKNFKDIINNNQNDKELIINLEDPYYNMTINNYVLEIVVITNLSFIGNENGTIFDYNNTRLGTMHFSVPNPITLKFKNIIFENFSYPNNVYTNDVRAIEIFVDSNKYYAIFENCTFRNNKQDILQYQINYLKKANDDFNIQFNNCNF